MATVGSGIGGVSNPNLTGGTLSPGMATYYDKVFLKRAKYALILKEGGQVRTHPDNEGRTVNFTRLNAIGIVTTPLGEMSNPVTCPINLCTVSMTLSEYGITTYTSRFGSLTSIDANMKEQIGAVGQNMGKEKLPLSAGRQIEKLSLDTLERLKYHSLISVRNYDTMVTRGKQPQTTDLAYIAGIVDGEATIGIYKKNNKRNKESTALPSFRERLSISNSNIEVLEYILSFFPYGSITNNTRYSNQHAPMYRLEYHVLQTLPILKAILPYLRIKKQQAEKVLEYRKTIIPIDKHTKGQARYLTEKEYRKREEFYLYLKFLNQRGRQPQRLSEITSFYKDDAIVRATRKRVELTRNESTSLTKE